MLDKFLSISRLARDFASFSSVEENNPWKSPMEEGIREIIKTNASNTYYSHTWKSKLRGIANIELHEKRTWIGLIIAIYYQKNLELKNGF